MQITQKISASPALIIFSVAIALLLSSGFLFANAQENETVSEEEAEAEELSEQDENITPQDLGVDDPSILPGSPLYFFKGIGRSFQSFTTFDSVKKAELKLKFANEKLIEAKKIAEDNPDSEKLEKALERYGREVERLEERIQKLEGKNKERVEKLIEKAADNQIKHHRILGKLMEENADISAEIEQRKAEAMKHFAESMSKVVDPEILEEKFIKAISEKDGSFLRQFKNIEVLEEVKDNVPDKARGAIQNAIEQSSKIFGEEFADANDHQRKIFHRYIEKIGGNEIRHHEAFDSIDAFADMPADMLEEMEKAREKTRERVEERMKSIDDDERKKIFLSHLESGQIENARILKELENNLSPETAGTITELRYKMEQKMRERFEEAESEDDIESLLKEVETFSDVDTLQTLGEMDELMPDDKKHLWDRMKQRVLEDMQRKTDKAKATGNLEDEMRKMATFDPEALEIFRKFENEFSGRFDLFENIKSQQAQKIEDRFLAFSQSYSEHPEDEKLVKRAEEFKTRIEENKEARNNVEQFAPEIQRHFDEFESQKEISGISRQRVMETIERAALLIKILEEKISSLDDEGSTAAESATRMLVIASEHLRGAKEYMDQERLGAAFGKATSAEHTAGNGIRHLEMAQFEKSRREYFMGKEGMDRENHPDMRGSETPKFDLERVRLPESIDAPEKMRVIDDENREKICAEVITPARNKNTKECKVFPNSCLPEGWVPDRTCSAKTQCPAIDLELFKRECAEKGGTVTRVTSQSCGDVPYCKVATEQHDASKIDGEDDTDVRSDLTGIKTESDGDSTEKSRFIELCKAKSGVIFSERPLMCRLPGGQITEFQ